MNRTSNSKKPVEKKNTAKATAKKKTEKKPLNVLIGKRISQARLSSGHTQEWLSEAVGVSLQYISDLERGIVGTSIPTLIKICKALDVSSDSLLFEDKESENLPQVLHKLASFTDEEVRLLERMIDLAQIALHYREIKEDPK